MKTTTSSGDRREECWRTCWHRSQLTVTVTRTPWRRRIDSLIHASKGGGAGGGGAGGGDAWGSAGD
eukprot:4474570-Prymnesium_polylepis.1